MTRIDHINIVVADMARSRAFYADLLGMAVTFEAELTGEWIETVTGLRGISAHCVWCQPPDGQMRLELLQYRTPPGVCLPQDSLANTQGLRHFALDVDDIQGWHARLSAAGVPFVSAPLPVPFPVAGGEKWICYGHDPDGVLIELAEYRRGV
ncbi:MAG: VOC family protein [Armatimonadetes bacterium]|nr:VOC family protein [Armatimonadota bacterium]